MSVGNDDASSSRIKLAEGKVSNGMRKTLYDMMNILQCPLCNEMFQRPTTLASCGHSFCEGCIDDYGSNYTNCPVPGCEMPMSIVGGRRGSFRKVNPQLAQCVESIRLVCQGLNQAPVEWWKTNDLVATEAPAEEPNSSHEGNFEAEGFGDESESDEENMIDLQPRKLV